ncbi:MAG: hypothetical protein NZZ41_04380 [Candidatus Dojkabacteria bacterium]|nr:hypothetical protein [Candidatus Dojkabacteria bacterium]
MKNILNVGIQGKEQSFSYIGLLKLLEQVDKLSINNFNVLYFDNFDSLFYAFTNNNVELMFLPIENSTFGVISDNIKYLFTCDQIYILSEVNLRIDLCLISFDEATVDSIRFLYSHPVALGQIKNFLNLHKNIQVFSADDTAGAVMMLAKNLFDKPDRNLYAAVASRQAAIQYNLQIIKESIQDNKQNYTRFFLVTKKNTFDSYSILSKFHAVDIINSQKKLSLLFTSDNDSKNVAKFLKYQISKYEVLQILSIPNINTNFGKIYMFDYLAINNSSFSLDIFYQIQIDNFNLKIFQAPDGPYPSITFD